MLAKSAKRSPQLEKEKKRIVPPHLEIYWSRRAEDHIARHGVTTREVDEAVDDCLYFRRQGDRYMAIGQTYSGRYITAVVVPTIWGDWNIITARPSNYREIRLVRRRRR